MKKSSGMVMVLVCLSMFSLAGCQQPDSPPPEKKPEKLLIGLIPEQNIFKQVERYEPLFEYLSRKSGTRLKPVVLTRYGNIIDNFVYAGLDGAIFGSFTYAVVHVQLGVEVIARPEDEDGSSTYHGLLLVRKDSGIKNARHMKGKRFAFVDQGTTAGYLFPLRYFKEEGIEDYRAHLGEAYYTGTHEDAIYDVLYGKADIAAAKNTVYERMAAHDSKIGDQLAVLARSPKVPENCLALRQGIDESTKRRLKDALLSMHLDPAGREILRNFGAKRFIATKDADYQAVYNYAREAGLDLATYSYR